MSWIQKLYETYENCKSSVGYSADESNRPLLPICHMTAQAHIEVVLDQDGKFRGASVIFDKKKEATTIIPCTEASGSRAGKKPKSHPLCDQLQYVAGDFAEYGGKVTSGFSADPTEPYRNYVDALISWCKSKFSHPKAVAVLKYVMKKSVVKDLVNHKKLFIGENGKLIAKKERAKEKGVLDIFDVVGSQDDVFVRWIVETSKERESKVWKDKRLWERWIQYYFSTKKKEPVCFATGKDAVLSNQHPKYIRAKGDGAKLISSNDTSGFTFRGRFLKAQQACNVSLEVSQKAHNALMWLIDRQGKVFWVKGDGGRKEPGLTVVAWAISGKKIPKVTDDTLSILGFDELPTDEAPVASTAQDTALRFKNRMLGYASELGDTENIGVIGLDSASKGRLAITYYRENLTASDFLKRINEWHETCSWIHEYRYKDVQTDETGKTKRFFQPFIGAPAPVNIAEAAYGRDLDDKLKKATIARILRCIIDGEPIPRDLVESAVRRASNRVGMDEWEWNKTLSIACALFKKYNSKEKYNMTLDPKRKTRDYLYGCLLAIADRLEGYALFKAGDKRGTNAARYMQLFAERPYKTWRQIELSLSPYKARLGGAHYYMNLIDEVMCKFDPGEYKSDKPLNGEFLLGYHCQRAELKPKSKTTDGSANENNNGSNGDQD